MVAQFIDDLQLCIPSVRIEAYRLPGQSDLDMVTNYFWNVELAKALHPSLHALEIAFRNSLHVAMSGRHHDYWFDHLHNVGALGVRQIKQVRSVRNRLSRLGKPHSADNIVAELMFGFWSDLSSSFYEPTVWRQNHFEMLSLVFPHGPRNLSLRAIGRSMSMANDLRNRMFHHEPIFADVNLGTKHQDIHQLMGWISPRLQQYIAVVDTFPIALQTGRPVIEKSIVDFV